MATEVVSASRTPLPVQSQPMPVRSPQPGTVANETASAASSPPGVSPAGQASGAFGVAQAAASRAAASQSTGRTATAQQGERPGATAEVDREMLERSVASVKEFIRVVDRQLDFEIDEATGRTLVRVVDPESGDVIRQVPPEAVVAAAQALAELTADGAGAGALSGLLFRDEA